MSQLQVSFSELRHEGPFLNPCPSLPPSLSRTPRGNVRLLLRTPSTTLSSHIVERQASRRPGQKTRKAEDPREKSPRDFVRLSSALPSPYPSTPNLGLLLPRPTSFLTPRYHIRGAPLPARAVMTQRIRPDIHKRPDRLGEHGEEDDEPARPGIHVAPVFWHVEVPPDKDQVSGYAAEVAG